MTCFRQQQQQGRNETQQRHNNFVSCVQSLQLFGKERTEMAEEGSKQRRLILSEEDYTSTLSMIIQRDYFPSLTDLERQSAVLERRLQGDFPGAVAVRRAARKLANHDEALAQEEEEDENDLIDGARKRARPLHMESLTGFHARATNEDDHEFDSQQTREVQANRERLEELFRPPKKDIKMIELSDMASDQFQAESNSPTDYNRPKLRNGLFFPPTPLLKGGNNEAPGEYNALLLAEAESADANQQQLAMPPPKSQPPSKTKFVPKRSLVEYTPKHTLEKKIVPSQTRFPEQILPFQTSTRVVLDTKLNQSDTDDVSTDASTDLDAPLRSIGEERIRREKKSSKYNKSYVNMTPLLVPGAGNQSPITTWGTVDSTPLVLSGKDNPVDALDSTAGGRSFALSVENERERAARKAEKLLQRRAKRAKSTMKSHRAKRIGSVTPSGTAFLTKRGSSRQRDSFASALRGSYTPKVRSLRDGSDKPRSTRDHAHNATPLASRGQKK
eukprot:scaffold22609_cov142-Cylindrotheca_fusiformis.AAC.9